MDRGAMRFRRRQTEEVPPPPAVGYSEEHFALEGLGLLSTRPGPDEAVAASGRFLVVAGCVMFVTAEVNHTTALERSGLPASADAVVGYYRATRPATGAPWRFLTIDHRLLRGGRVGPDQGSAAVTRAAFVASGYGDVSAALRR